MDIKKKIISDSIVSSIKSLLRLIRSIAVIPLITKLLGVAEYGIWVSIFAIIGVISTTADLHLHGALIRYTAGDEDDNQAYSDTLFLTLITVIVTGVLSLFTLGYVISYLLPSLQKSDRYLILITAIIGLTMLLNLNMNFFRAKHKVKLFELMVIAKLASETIVLICIFYLGGGIYMGLQGITAILSILVVMLIGYIFYEYEVPPPRPSNFIRIIRYSAPMTPKELSQSALTHADKFLILFYLSPNLVGIYSIAYGISSFVMKITGVLNSTLYPTVTQAWDADNNDEIKEVYKMVFKYYSILGIPSIIGIWILSPELISLISTPEAVSTGSKLVPLLLVGFFVRGYEDPLDFILTSVERTDIISVSVVISVILNIVLNIIFIPKIGLIGAAIATVISQVLVFIMVYYYAKKYIELYFPIVDVLRSTASAIVMGLILVFIIPLEGKIRVLIYPIVGAALYFALITFMGEDKFVSLYRRL